MLFFCYRIWLVVVIDYLLAFDWLWSYYLRERFPISQNFGWKFLQLPLSNGKDFFQSVQTGNLMLTGRSKNLRMAQQWRKKTTNWWNENFVQMKQVFLEERVKCLLSWPNTVFQCTGVSKHYLKTTYFWVPEIGMVQDSLRRNKFWYFSFNKVPLPWQRSKLLTVHK